ncbi:chloramphenicol acetyltransferase [Flavisolibacter tropicus]|uniref:Chloramphenicol acetyltransferase n=1 Tax=Flavisolibacter tropicus TaxID=1492898 RepID=A0A172TXR2_9BACT|nr:chloramphenicol acetyltransferase [Flavisolibacter tropicus]ANE51664.1 chloramphenicol acetyltransferase [Flavisolibacter tropicus]
MKQLLDIANWERKDQYQFFKQFDEPFFGVTVQVDVTKAYESAKEQHISFFLYYLYQSLVAANEVESFRYRIKGEEIWIFDEIHASPTINRPNGTFGFAYFDYTTNFQQFQAQAQEEINKVQNTTGLIPALSGENVIHYSSVPWINFTGISHARAYSFPDSCPKISFGKMTEENGRRLMPMSVHVHHALMDGFHVAQYIDRFQELLNGK